MKKLLILLLLGFGCQEPQPEAVESPRHQIAFQTSREGNTEVYLMNADGSELTNLTRHDSLDYHPSGSLDGAKITFVSGRDGNQEIYLMNADGSNQTNLTRHEAADIDPSFSPDGSQITFDSDRDGNVEVYVMDADGANVIRLTDHPGVDSHPYFGPMNFFHSGPKYGWRVR